MIPNFNHMSGWKGISFFAIVTAVSTLLFLKKRQDRTNTSGPDSDDMDSKLTQGNDNMNKIIKATNNDKGKSEKEKTIKDSVKPYDRHIIVFGAGACENWPSHIDDATISTTPTARKNSLSLVADMIKRVNEVNDIIIKSGKDAVNVIITCSSEPVSKNCELGYFEAVMYPEALIFQLAPSNLARFAELACSPKRNMIDMLDKSIFKCITTPWKHLIAVCAHEQRDKRCGRAGPQVIERIRDALGLGPTSVSPLNSPIKQQTSENTTASDIKVVSTSHIGGHAFAGVLIVYPIAHWYGQVSARGDSVQRILDEVNNNGCYEVCHRGTGKLVTW